jgi:Ca2+-binding EF-hand superfamily protein
MYKNAEKVLNDRDNISKAQVRNAVAKARIELNVRKINSMIHLIQPPSHDEVILPKNKNNANEDDGSPLDSEEMQKLRSEEQKMKIRLMKSAAMVPPEARVRPLDRRSIDRWVSKMSAAVEPFGDNKPRESSQKRKKKEQLSQAAIHTVEKKLQMAIRGEYRARMVRGRAVSAGKEGAETSPLIPDPDEHYDDEEPDEDENSANGSIASAAPVAKVKAEKKPILTTRMLLPYYKLEAVHQFMDIFAKVDENFSGDLDVNEWIRLFTSLNESVPVLEARMIFMKIDKDSDGFLTMRELIPVVFNKATNEQKRAIIAYAEMELTKKIETEQVPKVTNADLEFLFEAYDTENIGFVDVALIKERVRTLYLSEQALFHFMDSISDLADDEMVSVVEFKRLFRVYISTKEKGPGAGSGAL